MSCKIGYQSYVGWGSESTYGTGVVPSQFLAYNSESLQKGIEGILTENIRGTAQYKTHLQSRINITGGFDFPVAPGDLIKVLSTMFVLSTAANTPSAGVYTYTFHGRTVPLNKSLSVEKCIDTDDTTTVFRYTGCKVNTLNITNNEGELLNASVDFIGKDEATPATIATASYRDVNFAKAPDGTIKIGTSAASNNEFTNFSALGITINENLQEGRGISSNTNECIQPGMQDITWQLTGRFSSTTNYDAFKNHTSTYLYALYEADTISGHVTRESILFESQGFFDDTATPQIGGPNELVTQSLNFRALEDASITGIRITVVTDYTVNSVS